MDFERIVLQSHCPTKPQEHRRRAHVKDDLLFFYFQPHARAAVPCSRSAMAPPLVVLAVCFVHYALRYTAFIEPLAETRPSPANCSCLVLAAICMLLLDADDNWYRYRRRLAAVPRLLVDVCAAFVVLEFGMITIWSRLEQLIQVLVSAALLDGRLVLAWTPESVDVVAALLISTTALAVLLNTAWVTGWWSKVGKWVIRCWAQASMAVADRLADNKQYEHQSAVPEGEDDPVAASSAERQRVAVDGKKLTSATAAADTIKSEMNHGNVPTVASGAHTQRPVTPYRDLHPSRARNQKRICLLCEECR